MSFEKAARIKTVLSLNQFIEQSCFQNIFLNFFVSLVLIILNHKHVVTTHH
jgi:hypothetical protein